MLPKPPPREASLGYLFIPPFRIQGLSVAGESTCIQSPELDVCFDMGSCPRAMLTSKYVALSHGHMDHVGGLAYYCSQRQFQGMGTGTVICDERIAPAVRKMMAGMAELEDQQTPYELIEVPHEGTVRIKNNMLLRAFRTEHTSPSVGYVVIEQRTKLLDEYNGLPQEKLRELKDRGIEITRPIEIPLIAYLGDTAPGPHLVREDVRTAKIIVTECTFFEPEHRARAKIGMHLHVDDIGEWLPVTECEAMVITHVSRRTHLGYAQDRLKEVVGEEGANRCLFLMDHRGNRERFEQQLFEAERAASV